jgi:uncharacterized protein
MENLFEKYRKKLGLVSLEFSRSLMDDIIWDARMIGIKGARGVGKTTLLLQYIKKNLIPDESVLYISLDDIWFSRNSLAGLAGDFVKKGGKFLFLDEVHNYPDWSRELKNIYDDYPELKIVFTGSSLLEILNARTDLSRRAIVYNMQGLSFREYLNFVVGTELKRVSLESIFNDHLSISDQVLKSIRPLQYFNRYLIEGYYPFLKDVPELYHSRIENILKMIIEIELPLLRGVDIAYSGKLKQMLYVIAESAPFIPNISKLSEKIGINRTTFLAYLHYLQEAGILQNLYRETKGISRLQKPDKILLENPNIAFAINSKEPDIGSLRETFFANQVGYNHQLRFPRQGDFIIDDTYLLEIGGKNKKMKGMDKWSEKKVFIASDDIEYGHLNTIPLWLFGFIY